MNQCRFSNGKARIIRIEKIKASESLCWVWREGQCSPELVWEAAAVDGNRHAGTHGQVGDITYAAPEKPELGFRVNVLVQAPLTLLIFLSVTALVLRNFSGDTICQA